MNNKIKNKNIITLLNATDSNDKCQSCKINSVSKCLLYKMYNKYICKTLCEECIVSCILIIKQYMHAEKENPISFYNRFTYFTDRHGTCSYCKNTGYIYYDSECQTILEFICICDECIKKYHLEQI